jgi:hypothetical protein
MMEKRKIRTDMKRARAEDGACVARNSGHSGLGILGSKPGVVALRARPRANILNPFGVLSQGSTEATRGSRPTTQAARRYARK